MSERRNLCSAIPTRDPSIRSFHSLTRDESARASRGDAADVATNGASAGHRSDGRRDACPTKGQSADPLPTNGTLHCTRFHPLSRVAVCRRGRGASEICVICGSSCGRRKIQNSKSKILTVDFWDLVIGNVVPVHALGRITPRKPRIFVPFDGFPSPPGESVSDSRLMAAGKDA